MNKNMLFFVTAALIAASMAFAQQKEDAEKSPGKTGPCTADINKFCADTNLSEGGAGKLGKCMEEHKNQLSPECSKQREKAQAAKTALRTGCKEDIASLCKGINEENFPEVVKCFNSNEDKLSKKCKLEREKFQKFMGNRFKENKS